MRWTRLRQQRSIGVDSSAAESKRKRLSQKNKDVYMVALRDEDNCLIGYYEKHEYRNRETGSLYDFSH